MIRLWAMEFTHAILYAVLFISLYFEVFLLITFFETDAQVTEEFPQLDPGALPRVAVIVPCFNEETTVAGTLNSLLALKYPADKLEIIAVNDGSTDNTLSILREFEHHENIRVLSKKNGGKHTAMNLALKETTADIIGCLDADSFVDSDALMYVIANFQDENVAAVTPSIIVHEARGVLQLMQRAEYGIAIFVRRVFALLDSIFITPGPFSFFRRDVILEVGPWKHAHSTEDLEMGMRLKQHHKFITNEPRARVHTKAPDTLRTLIKQRVRWTYGFIKNAIDYSYMFFNPRYGTLGLMVLPMSVISLVSAIYLFLLLSWNTFIFMLQEIVRFQTVGITSPAVSFDVFYINTATVFTITLTLIAFNLVLMYIGKKLAKDGGLSFDVPLYIGLYGFIAPVWLTAALYKAIANTGVRWR